ncbi:MAG: hypothetical protein IKA47_03055, partial [Oscillospiraceae bacterium]|nr:hypothetical protein [Oscillospiraceae bacterium]
FLGKIVVLPAYSTNDVYTIRENGACIYTSQNEKIPTVDPPARRGKPVGILGVAFIGTREIHASQSAHRITGRR